MKKIKIRTKLKSFDVEFHNDFSFIDELTKIDSSVVIVGKSLYSLYSKKIFNRFPKNKLIVLPLEEENKVLETAAAIYSELLRKTPKKNLRIISFGGGVNQDVVGFVASTLYRGVDWIYVPTTLLAMVDSSVGLKTSLNFKNYKNVLGTFYPPVKVIINVDFLKTLPKVNYYSGVGEIIKFYLMKDNPLKSLDGTLEKIKVLAERKDNRTVLKIISESIKIKLSYMEGDEFDKGRRNLLNYGHELGHALESSSLFAIPHGVAVLIGIIFANIVSLRRGWISEEVFDKLNKKLLLPNIPLSLKFKKEYFDKNLILEYIKKDKKRVGEELVLVLPSQNFLLIKVNDLSVKEYESSLEKLRKLLNI